MVVGFVVLAAVVDCNDDRVAALGLIVERNLGSELSGGGVDVERIGVELVEDEVGQGMTVFIGDSERIADVGAGCGVLGYSADAGFGVGEDGGVVGLRVGGELRLQEQEQRGGNSHSQDCDLSRDSS